METDYCQRILLNLNQHYVTNISFLGLPGEVLVEIGLEIKKTGIENLFVISLTNDTVGYICPPQAYKEEGYEPGRETNLVEGAGKIYYKTGTEHH